ncbi:MAG TPA: hypothetical protein VMI55_05675 [Thermoplasmata archaeon]|nr:hypothetical protein [Thermoplasmata archaeon]
MSPGNPPPPDLRSRLDALSQRAHALEADGLPPLPIQQIQEAVARALAAGTPEEATQVIKRGEALLTKVSEDWTWVKELLRRAEELRAIAGTIGVDLAILDARVGNPRKKLSQGSLSSGTLDKTAASASLALAVLNDAVPKFCAQEAQQLGTTIRRARDRGEDVRLAAGAFSRLLQAIQDQNLPTAAQRLVEVRKEVARIPRAPAMPRLGSEEEEEILLEARNLARRLQRIKGKAHDAHSAARLMSQVRQALAEDRRYGTPEEEIEELWLEVSRITQENRRASEAPPGTTPGTGPRPRDERPASEVIPAAEAAAQLEAAAREEGPTPPPAPSPEPAGSTVSRRGFLVPYVPPEMPALAGPEDPSNSPTRPRPRPRVPP